MNNIIWFLIIVAALIAFIILIIATGKSKAEDDNKNYNPPEYQAPVRNIPPQQNQIEGIPIMTNHASQRMAERLGIVSYRQT